MAAGPSRIVPALLFAGWYISAAGAATFDVTTTADSGAGSLRQAIVDANLAPGLDTIAFAIADGGVPRISPATALPAITEPVLIDGTTQAPAGLVEIDGSLTTGARGLEITGGGSTIRGLVVDGFGTANLYIASGGDNVVEGCRIGTDPTGATALSPNAIGIEVSGSPDNLIDGNLISGNKGGISIHGAAATGNVVTGNRIGTDLAGTAAVENRTYGVLVSSAGGNVIGGSDAGAANVIAGNLNDGVALTGSGTSGNAVQGNLIGLGADAATPVPNGTHGVRLLSGAHDNVVGGTAGNVIAHNLDNGIILAINAGAGNTIRGNAIHRNGRLGIDLHSGGVTPNDAGDADTGANLQQNFPVLDWAFAGGTQVTGTLESAAEAPYVIEVFASDECDSSGNGEGAELLGSLVVETDGSGFVAFEATLARSVDAATEVLTATATDAAGNTSEFSACAPGPAPTTSTTSTTSTTTAPTSSTTTTTTTASTTTTADASTTTTLGVPTTTTVAASTTTTVGASTTTTVASTSTTTVASTTTTVAGATSTTVASTSTTTVESTSSTTTLDLPTTTVTTTSSTSTPSTTTTTEAPTTTTTTEAPPTTTTTTGAPASTTTTTTGASTTTTGAPPTTTTSVSPSTTTTVPASSTTTTTSLPATTTTTVPDGTTTTTTASPTTTSTSAAATTTTPTSSSTSTTDQPASTTSSTGPSTTTSTTPASTTTSTTLPESTTSTTTVPDTTTTSSTSTTLVAPSTSTTSSSSTSTSTPASTTTSTSVPQATTTTSTMVQATTTTTTLPCRAGEPCGEACPEGATFASLGCRVDGLGAGVASASDLGATMQARLGRRVRGARGALEVAAGHCADARPAPARRSLRRVAKRLASVRRALQTPRMRRLVPPAVATPLVGATVRLLADTRTLAGALDCR